MRCVKRFMNSRATYCIILLEYRTGFSQSNFAFFLAHLNIGKFETKNNARNIREFAWNYRAKIAT